MPQYHSYKHIKVRPIDLWRKVFRSWPYFVGDKVKFIFKIDVVPSGEVGMYSIFEVFGGKENVLVDVVKNETMVEGHVIPYEGDIVYSAGFRHLQKRVVIFTAKVINRDTIFFQWFWFILGAFVTFGSIILAWVLGFIQIVW